MSSDGSFERWYQDQHQRLLATMIVAAGDVDVARDVTDEAFTRAYERWARVAAMESPGGWTYRVALNVLRRRARRHALEQRLLRARHDPSDVPPPHLESEVWAALQALAPRQRTAVALRYLSGLTEVEVAAVMGVAPGTAARTLHDARRRLAAWFEPGPGPLAEEASP